MSAVLDYASSVEDEFQIMVFGRMNEEYDVGGSSNVQLEIVHGKFFSPLVYLQLCVLLLRHRPLYVHAHSSRAGVLVRLLPINRSRIMYTPHCFAFERSDVGPATRRFFRLAEEVLSWRTGTFIAVSPRERELALGMTGGRRAFYVPNSAPKPGHETTTAMRELTVAAVGRVSAQKGPTWFALFVAELRRLRPDARAVWIGTGPGREVGLLQSVGVEVTGWLSRDELLKRLREVAVYVHCAAWEGCPLTLLEAAAYDLPIVARDIPALRSLGVGNCWRSPRAAARWLVRTWEEEGIDALRSSSREIAMRHTASAQRAALLDVYLGRAV
jgi:glycosyltransferase involved in cell wall biosynthesis